MQSTLFILLQMTLSLPRFNKQAGALAQMVEQWTENPCVPGSIPGGTTKHKKALMIGSSSALFALGGGMKGLDGWGIGVIFAAWCEGCRCRDIQTVFVLFNVTRHSRSRIIKF